MDESIRRPAPISAHDVARILRRRAPIALLTFVLVCAAVALLTVRQHKVYQAQASILLDSAGSGHGVDGSLASLIGNSGSAQLDTEIAKIQSRVFLGHIIQETGLSPMKPEDLKGLIQVSAGPGGQIILVEARAATAALAQTIANRVVNDYIELTRDEFEHKSDWSEHRLIEARDQANQDKIVAETALAKFTAAAGNSQPMLYYTRQANRTVDAMTALADAQKALPIQEASLKDLQAKIKTIPQTVITSYGLDKFEVINQYRSDISKLETQRNDQLVDFAPDSDEVKTIDQQIENRKKALADASLNAYSQGGKSVGLNGDYVRLQSQIYDTQLGIDGQRQNISAWQKTLAKLKEEQSRLTPQQIRYEQLQRARDYANSAYEKARGGLQQLRYAKVTSVPDVHELDLAPLPLFPISPKPILNGIMAVFLGLFLGILAALVAEYLAGGFADEGFFEHLPLVGGVPLLGRLPSGLPSLIAASADSDHGLPVPTTAHNLALPGSVFEDALREIGYTLSHRDRRAPVPVILLTSVRSDDATATLAAQLTATLVRDGLRVTLIDADRDKPRLNHFFGAPDAPGLTDVLANRTKLTDALHVGVNGALRFLAAGSPGDTAPASEERLRSVLKELTGNPGDDITDVVFVSGPTVWNARQIAPLEKASGGMVLLTFGESGSPDESVARVRRLLSNGYKPSIRGVIVEQAHNGTAPRIVSAATPAAALVAPRGGEPSIEGEEIVS